MEHIASLSYGKDSLAMLEAIKILGLPLDRIVTAEVWATETVPAEFPEMVEFKKKADQIILDRYGIQVEHFRSQNTYDSSFHRITGSGKTVGRIYGFPMVKGAWCLRDLKLDILLKFDSPDTVKYLGIAADEPKRIVRDYGNARLPLVEIGWDEAYCRKWCEENDLLSPIYTQGTRGGCWFCHNQPMDQLRLLRKNYPELWQMMLLWDSESPIPFRSDGHTIHDLDKRFDFEDKGLVPSDRKFRWKMIE
jgi:3'-phosphoadenosine 5'-phosphosulfate sulfotransferase (PAPS reductase)/FAD synthetase